MGVIAFVVVKLWTQMQTRLEEFYVNGCQNLCKNTSVNVFVSVI